MTTFHPPSPPPGHAQITPRMADVLYGIALGHSNAEIGRHLHLTEDTVKTYVKRVLRVLGATNRAHAAALAYRMTLTVVDTNEVRAA